MEILYGSLKTLFLFLTYDQQYDIKKFLIRSARSAALHKKLVVFMCTSSLIWNRVEEAKSCAAALYDVYLF